MDNGNLDETVYTAAVNLAAKLRESGPYKAYLEAKEAMSSSGFNDINSETKFMLEEYRRLTLDMARAEDRGDADLLNYKQRVSAAYFAAAANPSLQRLMDAERAVTVLMCEVLDIVAESCELWDS